MENAPIIKPDGTKQRTDVTLTADIAGALVKKVLSGQAIYAEEGALEILVGEGETERTEEVSPNTLSSWLRRDVVIPGEGRTLRSALDEAREERIRAVREARQKAIIENAEAGIAELVRIPIESGMTVETRFRRHPETGVYAATGKTETEYKGVNPKLAEAKMKAIGFALERLEPKRYGARLETKNTHAIFSLSDLRKARAHRDELAATGQL